MSVHRLFAVGLGIIGAIGLGGALSVDMFRGETIGSGFMPTIYAVALLACSVLFFLADKENIKMNPKTMFDKFSRLGWIYYLMCFAMVVLVGFIGMIPAMGLFGFTSQVALGRQRWQWSAIFSLLWSGALYVVFVVLLKLPLA